MSNKFDKLIEDRLNSYRKIVERLPLEDYQKELIKNHWLDFIRLMEKLTKRHFRRHNILTIITILFGVLIPLSMTFELIKPYDKIIPAALGVIVSATASINQSFRPARLWMQFRQIAEALKIEGEKYFSLCAEYAHFTEHRGEAFKFFMKRIERIKESQISSYLKSITPDDNNSSQDTPSDKNKNQHKDKGENEGEGEEPS